MKKITLQPGEILTIDIWGIGLSESGGFGEGKVIRVHKLKVGNKGGLIIQSKVATNPKWICRKGADTYESTRQATRYLKEKKEIKIGDKVHWTPKGFLPKISGIVVRKLTDGTGDWLIKNKFESYRMKKENLKKDIR